jgi:glycerol-3-phosphate dehydrogenase
VLRRTELAFKGRIRHEHIVEIAGAMAAELGWDDDRTRREVDRCETHLESFHGAPVRV